MDTEEYIKKRIGKPISRLGEGYFGEAWLMKDGSVVKITKSHIERNCVRLLFDAQEENPEKYIEYFPKIYAYGDIKTDKQLAPRPFIFWYQKEELDDVPAYPFSFEIMMDFRQKVRKELGIDAQDLRKSNFGVRSSQPNKLLLRDLECEVYTEQHTY